MVKRTVTLEDVDSALREYANEKPLGYVYRRRDGSASCTNTELVANGDRVPSCIVGTFFVRELGINVNEVPEYGSALYLFAAFRDQFNFTLTAQRALMMAQTMQDNGVTWSRVAELAPEMALINGDEGFTGESEE